GSTATDRRYGPARRHALGLVSAAIALFIDDRGRFGLIDRLRQCCQLAVGARDGATERDRRAAGVGRGTFPPRAATAHWKRVAGAGGWSAGIALRSLGQRFAAEPAVFGAGNVVFAYRSAPAHSRVYAYGFGSDRAAIRAYPRLARDAC